MPEKVDKENNQTMMDGQIFIIFLIGLSGVHQLLGVLQQTPGERAKQTLFHMNVVQISRNLTTLYCIKL